jgi:hypothetical protein
MRWLAALAAGICAAIALFATFYGQKAFDHWQSDRAELLARIASLESDPGRPNRDANLESARQLLDLANGVALEKVGLSVLALVLAVAGLVASWRHAARFFSRTRLVILAALGTLIPVVVGVLVLLMLGAGAIRG